MKETHRIELPRIVLVGAGVLNDLGEICVELGFKRALIVSGRKTFKVAGERAVEILKRSGLEVEATSALKADLDTVHRVAGEASSMGAEVVIGVGGGRVIDVAKMAAARSRIDFISAPTTASHDGIASSLASIKGLGRPYSVKAVAPIAVVADSEVIASAPYRLTASGCGDVIAKVVAVRDWRLAHEVNGEYYGEYAASLALMSSNLVMRSSELIREGEEEGIRTLIEALVSCGVAMSIAGSSRPCSGSEHLFSHALDLIAPRPALHGEQCGVGTIMMAKLHGLNWMEIRERLRAVGAPTTAEELGIEPRYIVEALVRARWIRPGRYTILDEVKLTSEEAKSLAEECGVI